MQGNPAFNSLIEMGCNPVLIQTSIRKLKTQDLSALLDWISEHSEQQQKWSEWLKENPQQEGTSINQQAAEGQGIQNLVNKQFRDQLIAKGNSKNVAEKSLLLTNNASLQSAEKWIEDHKYDADFEEELRLQGEAFEGPKLSPEEARIKLEQLSKKAREARQIREKQEAKQKEKDRVRYTKQMQEAKVIAEEQSKARNIDLQKIQKRKDEQYKKKLLEEMRRQKNARFGIKQEEGTNQVTKKQEPKLSHIDQIQLQCEQIKVGNHAYPELAKTFFDTAHIYMSNIVKNNGEEKFRKINKENKAFQNRICQAFGGVQWLTVLGYVEEDNVLILKHCDIEELKRVINILDLYRALY